MSEPTMTDFARFLGEIENAEQRAHQLGLIATAHLLHQAKNKAGWEIADDLGKRSKRAGIQLGGPATDGKPGRGQP